MRRATRAFLRQLAPKQIFKENGLNKVRLPWWGVLSVVAGSLVFGLVFDFFGQFELARPVIISTAIICIAVAFRWQLRRHLWFWVVVAVTVAFHALAIVYQGWTTKWIPAAVTTGYMTVDLYVILVLISVVRKFEGDNLDSDVDEPAFKRQHRFPGDRKT